MCTIVVVRRLGRRPYLFSGIGQCLYDGNGGGFAFVRKVTAVASHFHFHTLPNFFILRTITVTRFDSIYIWYYFWIRSPLKSLSLAPLSNFLDSFQWFLLVSLWFIRVKVWPTKKSVISLSLALSLSE